MRGQATVHVEAPPEKVYELVSDITRTGEWSAECHSAEWVGGTSGPEVGARFKGRNRRGLLRWSTTSEVTACVPAREFAFHVGTTTWRYMFEPVGGGTDVTESFETSKYGALYKLLTPEKKRQAQLQQGMEATLARLKAVAEGSA